MKHSKLKKTFNSILKTILFFGVFSLIMVSIIYSLTKTNRKLPVFNPVDVNPRLVDKSVRNVKRGHKIADFNLINQFGDTITQNTFKDKIYVANFFFTSCKGICPVMATNMKSVQEKFKDDKDILFLSMSVTPLKDSVSVLKKYAKEKGAINNKWHFTTGDKKHIYNLARKSYMAVLDEGDGDEQDFIHTEQFMLIDKKRQIRGFYDGTKPEDIELLKKNILILKKE
jgi:protein SCO1/2